MDLLNGLYGDKLTQVQDIIELYNLYDGKQEWDTPEDLDYIPTKKITNYIKKLINTKARFMFGKYPFFDVRAIKEDESGSTVNTDLAQEKEDLLHKILKKNKFHSKLLKGKKDCSIGGKVAIKLWAAQEEGIKIIFSPAQEFFATYDIDDVDILQEVKFVYPLDNEENAKDQRFTKQTWTMVNGFCILNEAIFDGNAELIEPIWVDHNTKLDFIPVVIIQNGGLTGETEGSSDVSELWSNQDVYNRLTSDDRDALKFQMFGQDVVTDASENSLKKIKRAPGAMVDLQTDTMHNAAGRQAAMNRLESNFSYGEKYTDTVGRTKNDMFDLMDVPNVSLEQLRGLMTSGKSMKALYWGLIAVCEEEATEWEPALEQMIEYIFKMVSVYNLYEGKQLAEYETSLEIIRTYPLPEDTDDQKRIDMEEVIAGVRSKKSYINKWSNVENVDGELEQILLEKAQEEGFATADYNLQIAEGEEV